MNPEYVTALFGRGNSELCWLVLLPPSFCKALRRYFRVEVGISDRCISRTCRFVLLPAGLTALLVPPSVPRTAGATDQLQEEPSDGRPLQMSTPSFSLASGSPFF